MPTITIYRELNLLGEHALEIEYDYLPGARAKVTGRAEDCSPAEPAELTVNTIKLFGQDITQFIELDAFIDDIFDEVAEAYEHSQENYDDSDD